jgi:hypothetical protein
VRIAVTLETEETEAARSMYNSHLDAVVAARLALKPGQKTSDLLKKARGEMKKFLAHHEALTDDGRCSSEFNERSCIYFAMPQTGVRPTLLLTSAGNGTAVLDLHARDMNPDDVLEVVAKSDNGVMLYRVRLSADSSGGLDKKTTLTMPGGAALLCAAGRIVRAPALTDPTRTPPPLSHSCPSENTWNDAIAEVSADAPGKG